MGLVEGDQAVGPAAHPGGGVGADGRPDQLRRPLGEGPEPGPVDRDQPVVADRLAGQQRPDDRDGLAQPGPALLLGRPAPAGDVLVGGLAAAEGQPEPLGKELAQGGRRLGDDRRVVALPGRVDHPEAEAGRLQGRSSQDRRSRCGPAGCPGREVVEHIAAWNPPPRPRPHSAAARSGQAARARRGSRSGPRSGLLLMWRSSGRVSPPLTARAVAQASGYGGGEEASEHGGVGRHGGADDARLLLRTFRRDDLPLYAA